MMSTLMWAATELDPDVSRPLRQLLSWLLWGCEVVLLAKLIAAGAQLWMERRQSEMHGRHAGTAIAVTLVATAVAAVAVPIAATALGS
ncbi:hypothetical protein HLB23_24525 [Nocardia uniformis]|uniref:Uncharacterized protein n=1 Tax=Nocardia uniformis TaxID=53432 RepID=A0A849CAL6_9NOCA|nr:hypothetical protein [Nocardia uniformis]NNH72987.1 hypothetical protein [Nocardia uniformis]